MSLLDPERLWSRAEVLARPCPVPSVPGVYAWYFREVPAGVPTDGCVQHHDLTLLYVGIAPKQPPKNSAPPSRQTLRSRLRYHFRGNAEGSTLRLTLGCLLGLALRRVGSGTRMTFAADEEVLSDWMAANAFVTWVEHPEPWVLEEELISRVVLPLNLARNQRHPFHQVLTALRREARERAHGFPLDH